MRIIIELPRLNENHKSLANIVNKNVAQLNHKSLANIVNKNVAQLTFTTARLQRQGHLNTGTLYRYNSKSYKFVAIILIGIIY